MKAVPTIKARRHVDDLALFMEAKLPIKAMATLTLPARHRSLSAMHSLFEEWIKSVSCYDRRPIAWIRAHERSEWDHLHALLIAYGPLSLRQAEASWLGLCGSNREDHASVVPYLQALGGAQYVLKSIDRDLEDIQLSNNLQHFRLREHCTPATSNAKDRRRYRRARSSKLM